VAPRPRRVRLEAWSGTVARVMVPEKPLNKSSSGGGDETNPPVIVPPLNPTSELGMVVVKSKNKISDVLLSAISCHPPLEDFEPVTLLKSASPGNVMSTLLTVPFVTSTASAPLKVPEEPLVKVPETSKVVMMSAFATPLMSVSARTIRARAKRCVFFFCVFMRLCGLMRFYGRVRLPVRAFSAGNVNPNN